ncbi:uncharacterized protein KY384_001195 [Bacidia gigantensis]|uniref:uncharacterized protein n=1 Tax=Bacidia gigantensis TaxID=2732470 RepID=UPI001D03A5AE|nr:uncharacterized protein KY384_001195 [Bacidia gigantensis]KAG8534351.1 hypothetical protein KY384_001195 [Bacidia gigantensis]
MPRFKLLPPREPREEDVLTQRRKAFRNAKIKLEGGSPSVGRRNPPRIRRKPVKYDSQIKIEDEISCLLKHEEGTERVDPPRTMLRLRLHTNPIQSKPKRLGRPKLSTTIASKTFKAFPASRLSQPQSIKQSRSRSLAKKGDTEISMLSITLALRQLYVAAQHDDALLVAVDEALSNSQPHETSFETCFKEACELVRKDQQRARAQTLENSQAHHSLTEPANDASTKPTTEHFTFPRHAPPFADSSMSTEGSPGQNKSPQGSSWLARGEKASFKATSKRQSKYIPLAFQSTPPLVPPQQTSVPHQPASISSSRLHDSPSDHPLLSTDRNHFSFIPCHTHRDIASSPRSIVSDTLENSPPKEIEEISREPFLLAGGKMKGLRPLRPKPAVPQQAVTSTGSPRPPAISRETSRSDSRPSSVNTSATRVAMASTAVTASPRLVETNIPPSPDLSIVMCRRVRFASPYDPTSAAQNQCSDARKKRKRLEDGDGTRQIAEGGGLKRIAKIEEPETTLNNVSVQLQSFDEEDDEDPRASLQEIPCIGHTVRQEVKEEDNQPDISSGAIEGEQAAAYNRRMAIGPRTPSISSDDSNQDYESSLESRSLRSSPAWSLPGQDLDEGPIEPQVRREQTTPSSSQIRFHSNLPSEPLEQSSLNGDTEDFLAFQGRGSLPTRRHQVQPQSPQACTHPCPICDDSAIHKLITTMGAEFLVNRADVGLSHKDAFAFCDKFPFHKVNKEMLDDLEKKRGRRWAKTIEKWTKKIENLRGEIRKNGIGRPRECRHRCLRCERQAIRREITGLQEEFVAMYEDLGITVEDALILWNGLLLGVIGTSEFQPLFNKILVKGGQQLVDHMDPIFSSAKHLIKRLRAAGDKKEIKGTLTVEID